MKQSIKSIRREILVLLLANMSLEFGSSVSSFTSPPFQKNFGCCKIRLYQPRSRTCHKVLVMTYAYVIKLAVHIIQICGWFGGKFKARVSNYLQRQTLAVYHSNILIDHSILSTPGIVSVYDVICHNPNDVRKLHNLLVTRLRIMQCNCLYNLQPQCN